MVELLERIGYNKLKVADSNQGRTSRHNEKVFVHPAINGHLS